MLAKILYKALAALGLVLLLLSQASAHTDIATTIPDHEAVLNTAPKQLRFLFRAEVTITNIRIEIVDGKNPGARIKVNLPRNRIGQSTAFGKQIALEIPELNPATYKVVWQAMSRDGHFIVDDFTFTVTE